MADSILHCFIKVITKNLLTFLMLLITVFSLSTMMLLLPRIYIHTQESKSYLDPPVVLSRNLHFTPELQSAPGVRDSSNKFMDEAVAKPPPIIVAEKSSESDRDKPTIETRALSLIGRISVDSNPMDIAQIVAMFSFMKNGHFIPSTFPPEQKVAILIPYRNRRKHLYTLIPVLIPMLMRQNLEFAIFVVELDQPTTFNKGALFNAGFLEIMKTGSYDCIILHDVDLIPLDDRNLYRCDREHPIHFSANIVDYKYFYNGLFGGVVGFTPAQFRAINGASNLYFGWGGEDDDLRDRALGKNFTILRKPAEHAVYKMVNHTRRGYWKVNPNRFRMFASRRDRWSYDGLNSLRYDVSRVMNKQVLIWIHVAVNATKIQETLPDPVKARQEEDYVIDVESGIVNLKCSSSEICPPS